MSGCVLRLSVLPDLRLKATGQASPPEERDQALKADATQSHKHTHWFNWLDPNTLRESTGLKKNAFMSSKL